MNIALLNCINRLYILFRANKFYIKKIISMLDNF